MGVNEYGTVYVLKNTGGGFVIMPITSEEHITQLANAFGGAVGVSSAGHVKLMQNSFRTQGARMRMEVRPDGEPDEDTENTGKDMKRSGTLYCAEGSSVGDAIAEFARAMAEPTLAPA